MPSLRSHHTPPFPHSQSQPRQFILSQLRAKRNMWKDVHIYVKVSKQCPPPMITPIGNLSFLIFHPTNLSPRYKLFMSQGKKHIISTRIGEYFALSCMPENVCQCFYGWDPYKKQLKTAAWLHPTSKQKLEFWYLLWAAWGYCNAFVSTSLQHSSHFCEMPG